MNVKGKYIVLEGVNGIALHGDGIAEVSYKESAYKVLFKGTLKQLKASKYKNLIIE